jgi:hypothetical protein
MTNAYKVTYKWKNTTSEEKFPTIRNTASIYWPELKIPSPSNLERLRDTQMNNFAAMVILLLKLILKFHSKNCQRQLKKNT